MSCEGSSGYSPSSIVTTFHNIPHIDINLQPVSSDFSISLNYFQPIIIWACVPVLACVCLFILLSVYYICICCCCCCRDKKARPKVTKIICAFFVCLVILFCCGMIGASIYSEVELNSFISSFIRDAEGVDQTVNQVTLELNTYPSGNVGSALQSISSAISSSSAPDAEKTIAINTVNTLMAVNNETGSRISEVNTTTLSVDVGSTLDTVSFFETIRHWSVIGYLAFIVVILLIVFLVTVCMSPIGMVIMLVVLGILTLTVWIAVGASLASVVVLSDICVDPDNLIRNNTPTDARDVVDYYITCSDTCVYGEELMALRQLAEQSHANNFTHLEDFNTMYNLNQQNNINTVENGFNTGRTVAINVTELLTCNTMLGIHQNYLAALNTLCSLNGGYVYALVLFSLAAGLAISLLLLMCCVTGFAGLLANTRPDEVDRDDFLALETEHTVAWNNRRASYTEPYSSAANGTSSSYRTVREDYPMQPIGSTLGVVEPPKYSDLNAPRQPGRPNSGDYDHFDA